jgi:putative ABC transport system permease protein
LILLLLVLIGVLISTPVTWWLMQHWLTDFAHRIEMRWWMFAAAGFFAVLTALLTVGVQAVRAAVVNPVQFLRRE